MLLLMMFDKVPHQLMANTMSVMHLQTFDVMSLLFIIFYLSYILNIKYNSCHITTKEHKLQTFEPFSAYVYRKSKTHPFSRASFRQFSNNR